MTSLFKLSTGFSPFSTYGLRETSSWREGIDGAEAALEEKT